MSDLVGNPEDRFSQNEAHILMRLYSPFYVGSPEDRFSRSFRFSPENCVEEFMECTAPLNPEKGGGDMFSKVHNVGGGLPLPAPTDLEPNYMDVPTFYSNVPKQITILCG